jgi:hypothetical protein
VGLALHPGVKRFGDNCGQKLVDYVGDVPSDPTLCVMAGFPKSDAWAKGQRSIVCAAMSKGERWSSIHS